MSREIFVVSVPIVVVRNYVVSAAHAEDAKLAIERAPAEWFSKCMHNERLVGLYSSFEGTPIKVTPIKDLEPDSEPDIDLKELS